MGAVGIIANPVSGKDVRRVAARGQIVSMAEKRNRIARAVVGAATSGATDIHLMAEPFGVSTGAVADLDLGGAAEVHVIDVGARVSPDDTARATREIRARGVAVVVVLGGDGTSRVVAKEWPDAVLVPMSTGTNNVFPTQIEPTIAGAAAGLVAAGRIGVGEVAPRAKIVRVDGTEPTDHDLALIDAVHLHGDVVGNHLPYDATRLRTIVLSRAEPAAIGVSATGGLTCPCPADADAGVVVECGPGGADVQVPLAPGYYRPVPVLTARRIELGEHVRVTGTGVLAFDGDRVLKLRADEPHVLRVERDGPRVIDVPLAMALAADRRLYGGVATSGP